MNDHRKALEEIERLLTNLQPHIVQACYPGRHGFIDNYVDPALEIARAALAQPATVQGWRPIETAPKDGTHVDLWCVPRYENLGGRRPAPGRMTEVSFEAGAWRDLSWSSDGSPGPVIDMDCTHWMPLPQPPEAAQASATEMDHRSGGIEGTTECQGKEGGSAAVAADARERERFEEFHAFRKSKGTAYREGLFVRRDDGTYADDSVQRHWWTWQNALAAMSTHPAAIERCQCGYPQPCSKTVPIEFCRAQPHPAEGERG